MANGMVSKTVFRLIAAAALSLATFGQHAPRMTPVPGDALELVTGQVRSVDTKAGRDAKAQLLTHARDSYNLRSAARGYDLKVTFQVNSGGQTEYDGTWEMEDVFDPRQGLRWTAKAASGYTVTQISSKSGYYREGTSNTVPLRLQEARAALFDPIPPAASVANGLIRTSTATFKGVPLTCVLLSSRGSTATGTAGRSWEETEACIDPRSGLLQVQSQVPGRYYSYDYSNAPQLGGHILPRKVTVTEAGKVVSEISVESLKRLPAADSALFVPTAEMKQGEPAIQMAGAQKLLLDSALGPLASSVTSRPVCVFGLVTSSGQLVEAHSLQPSDPNSPAAVDAAKRMNFFSPTRPGARHQQHFVFIIERFPASQAVEEREAGAGR